MREALDRAGGDPASLQVVGILPALSRRAGGWISPAPSPACRAVASGATDVRLTLRVPDDPVQHFDQVSAVVAEFRAVTGYDFPEHYSPSRPPPPDCH